MERVGVIGLGNWGTALGQHLACKGFAVLGWDKNPEIAEGISRAHRNPLYIAHAELNERFNATTDFEQVLQCEILVLVVPSFALAQVVPRMQVPPSTLIISAIKGLERETLLTPVEYLRVYLPAPANLAVLSGPSFAKDIIKHEPCGIVAASHAADVARRAAEVFSNDSMRVYMSLDPIGVEIGAVVKNVIAIAAGVSDGMGFGDSARAGLITRGLAEMMRLATALGGDAKTLAGLSGLGDLVMTASCDASRNRTVGLRLGRGESLTHIVETIGSVAEGVGTTPLVLELARRHNVDVPITTQVARLLNGDITASGMLEAFFKRPLKMEFY